MVPADGKIPSFPQLDLFAGIYSFSIHDTHVHDHFFMTVPGRMVLISSILSASSDQIFEPSDDSFWKKSFSNTNARHQDSRFIHDARSSMTCAFDRNSVPVNQSAGWLCLLTSKHTSMSFAIEWLRTSIRSDSNIPSAITVVDRARRGRH